jgi:hypothetical protein
MNEERNTAERTPVDRAAPAASAPSRRWAGAAPNLPSRTRRTQPQQPACMPNGDPPHLTLWGTEEERPAAQPRA